MVGLLRLIRLRTLRSSVSATIANVSTIIHEDPTLAWARANPVEAQEYLNVPSADLKETVDVPSSLETYCEWRRWTSISKAPSQFGSNLVSHVLSAPLTAASHLLQPSASQVWCVLGARAESMLPVEYWREALIYLSSCSGRRVDEFSLQLDFVGPEISYQPPVTLGLDSNYHNGLGPSYARTANYTLHLNWAFQGTFHAYCDRTPGIQQRYNAFILLNPGIGHAHLKQQWKPSLDRLLQLPSTTAVESSTLLFTAHSMLDAQRDSSVLQSYVPADTSVEYWENPFASRITYQDPLHPTHYVRPNHYAYVLRTPW
jgi:hypothetical protein